MNADKPDDTPKPPLFPGAKSFFKVVLVIGLLVLADFLVRLFKVLS